MLKEIRHDENPEINTYRLYAKLNELVEAERDSASAIAQIRYA